MIQLKRAYQANMHLRTNAKVALELLYRKGQSSTSRIRTEH